MKTPETPHPLTGSPSRQVVQTILQLVALALLLKYCYNVLLPFINPLVWAIVLAVSLHPVHKHLKRRLRGRTTLTTVALILFLLLILILPAVWLSIKTGTEIKGVADAYLAGNYTIPPLPEGIKGVPLLGNTLNEIWNLLSTGIGALVEKYPEQTQKVAETGISLLASTGKGLLLFGLAILICGILLNYAEELASFSSNFFQRLLNSSKIDMASIAAHTIRNTVKRVFGVALIQSMLAAAGMLVAGIPYAGVWALLCLLLAVMQIGIFPVAIGVIIYIWSTGSTLAAILLTAWMIFVGIADNILNPLLIGKGTPVPAAVIFLGSLGGFIYAGFIGLFTGAVILSLGYKLFDIWLKETEI